VFSSLITPGGVKITQKQEVMFHFETRKPLLDKDLHFLTDSNYIGGDFKRFSGLILT